VLSAKDGNSDERRRSIETLCETYWPPLYAYVRSRGYDSEEAKDLTQEYFAMFIGEQFLTNVSKEKGRFRNFLLASLKNFLANEWHKNNAQKRGGGVGLISIDTEDAESKLGDFSTSGQSPENIYRRSWALALLQRAYDRLKSENSSEKRLKRFQALESYITTSGDRVPYAELEKTTGVSASALKVSVHRLRKRYGELIRDEIHQTVDKSDDIDAELQDLMSALSAQ
jgi:RNA polymerase sigma-70 factor (ECF subfamily)